METVYMNSNKYLFSNFLEDKKVFNLAEAYWRRIVSGISGEKKIPFQSYLNHFDSEGKKEYDANPIYDAIFPTLSKALRIIQDTPEKDTSDITVWIDKFEPDEDVPVVHELVIALALSRETAEVARRLLRQWIIEDFSPQDMERAIEEIIK
jgi:hypothetical protein